MSRTTAAAVLLCVLVGALLVGPGALAAESCVFSDGTVTLTSDAGPTDEAIRYLRVTQNGSTLEFWLESTDETVAPALIPCNNPQVSNTALVFLTMTNAEWSAILLDMEGGTFGPQAGTTSVSFSVDQSAGSDGGVVQIHAHASGGRITAGAETVNLDNDAIADMQTLGTNSIGLIGSASGDVLSLAGGNSTGAPSSISGYVIGGGGADVLRGGQANDEVNGGDGNDRLYGGAGADRLGNAVQTFQETENGSDRLFGEAGADALGGASGNDTLVGGAGRDGLSGGIGVDTASYAGSSVGVRVDIDGDADDGTYTNGTSEGDNVRLDVENLIGSARADRLTGRKGSLGASNVLTGGGGNDVLSGLDGADVLRGQDGRDELIGGANIDECLGGPGEDILRTCERP